MPGPRAGKTSLCISDYTGGEKYSKGKRGQKLKDVRAREEARDGRPYFASPEKGERCVFSEGRKERAVDYWLGECEGSAISSCAKEVNLYADTLIDWVAAYGRGRFECSFPSGHRTLFRITKSEGGMCSVSADGSTFLYEGIPSSANDLSPSFRI
ncbi:MAG: hypothetical protein OXF02_06585 [Simkaniaceae bacterium]|nr:hypothetical protein [Simkaniaceae bacterium]